MTADSGAPEAALDIPSAAVAAASNTRPFYWSVRRELWENRSLYIAPLSAAGVILFGFAISTVGMAHLSYTASIDGEGRVLPPVLPYHLAAMAIIVTSMLVSAFYCLGALHNERRDRSILFWKSLPVSDLTTVLSKAVMPLAVQPAIICAVVIATQLVMLALNAAGLAMHADGPASLLTHVPILQIWLVLIYGMATTALWLAPVWGWCLLVSAWAKRTPFLWAILPPMAVGLVEKMAFDTSHFTHLLGYRLTGGFDAAFTDRPGGELASHLPQLDPAGFLTTPGLWIGLAVAAAFLAAAVRLRRYREPI